MLPDNGEPRQFCPLAAGLEVVGDMWTMLVVRELLVAPADERELLEGVPGLTPSLLAPRLEALCERGIAEWEGEYRLTPLGRRLQGPLLALARWGSEIAGGDRAR